MESVYKFSPSYGCQTAGHGTRRRRKPPRRTKTLSASAILSRATEQLKCRPLSTAWTVAVRGTRLQINAVASSAYLAVHPLKALGAAKDIALHPLDRVDAVFNDILGPTIVPQEHKRSDKFDVKCINERLQKLRTAHNDGDLLHMLQLARTQLTRLLGEINNAERTKWLIGQYTDTVCDVFKEIGAACERDDAGLDKRFVAEQLDFTRESFGLTALFLSGGGTLGMTHIGVIKTLFEAGSLPRIIAGSSAGAIVCAALCTKRNHEIPGVLESFCKGDLKVFVGDDEEQGCLARLKYLWKHGHLFNAENLRRVMKHHLGNLTFKEAYNLTGRVLNITVSSSNNFESLGLLNYATAGNIVIWSAVVASCALPFGYEAGELMVKRRNDEIVQYDEGTRHVDGSIEGDLPFDKVSTIFNVNNFVASQVNPHITPFLRDLRRERGQLGVFWDDVLDMAKEDMAYWVYPGILPCVTNLRQKAASIIDQKYTGDITILPRTPFSLLFKVLSNPTPEFMEGASLIGERATLEALGEIKNHVKIERAIEAAMNKANESVNFSRSASNLRKLELERSGKVKRSGRGTKRIVTSTQPVPRIRLNTHADLFGNLATKVAGDLYSATSSSSSSRVSFLLGSDEESDRDDDDSNTSPSPPIRPQEPEMAIEPLETLSAPASPMRSFKSLFTSPRPASPGSTLPVSLMMTSLSKDTKSSISPQDSPAPRQCDHSGGVDSSSQHVCAACTTKKLTRKRSLSAEARLCTVSGLRDSYEA